MKHMKRIILYASVVLTAFRLMAGMSVQAHGTGPPYIKIDGQYALSNPILNIAQPTTFTVSADVASSSGYLVGKPITFVVDEQFFPNPYLQAGNAFGLPVANVSDAPKPQFRWDFKDGSQTVDGGSVSHVFAKPGTYVIELLAKFEGKTPDFDLVNTIQLDILPDAQYQRPKPVITVNGRVIADKERDAVDIKPMTPVAFDAAKSQGEITVYQWDFGDGKGSTDKETKHRYARDEYFPVAILRVIDSNNIMVDTYALLNMPFEKSNVFLKIWYSILDFFSGLFYRDK